MGGILGKETGGAKAGMFERLNQYLLALKKDERGISYFARAFLEKYC